MTLLGYNIQVAAALAGQARGVLMDRTVYVSPEFIEKAGGATDDELVEMFESLEVLNLPALPDFVGKPYLFTSSR